MRSNPAFCKSYGIPWCDNFSPLRLRMLSHKEGETTMRVFQFRQKGFQKVVAITAVKYYDIKVESQGSLSVSGICGLASGTRRVHFASACLRLAVRFRHMRACKQPVS